MGLLVGCASSPPEEPPPADSGSSRCELLEVGLVRIERAPQDRESLRDKLRSRGYDRMTDVRGIRETWRDSSGTLHQRLVAWEGVAWRWNDPGCRIGRRAPRLR